MNQVPGGSSALQVPVVNAGAAKQAMVPGLLTLPASGYLYVYVSNESPQAVYFDDIVVQHFTGPLLSEDSYHPFGGTMAALSSKAFGKPATRYKYNGGTELNDDLELNYYETFYLNYDAQIGRFTGVDLLAEKYYSSTPYHFGLNNPVYFNDPSGLKSGRMEKGPDGNYHVGWVTEMAWNNLGFYNSENKDVYFDDAGGGSGGSQKPVYTNQITGITSAQLLNWLRSGERIGKSSSGEFGYWQKFNDNSNKFSSTGLRNVIAGSRFVPLQLRDNSIFIKYGASLNYFGGMVQNWRNGNGEKLADFKSEYGIFVRFPGASIFHMKRGGITLPEGSIYASSDFNLADLQHEYGHVLQQLMYSRNDFLEISILSGINAGTSSYQEHNNYWTEKDANAWSALYFGPNSAIAKDPNLPKEFSDVFFKNFPVNK